MIDNKIIDDFLTATTLANSKPAENTPSLDLPNGIGEIIKLPEPELLADVNVNFLELVEIRSTVRQYQNTPLTQKDLSYLLWCTQGVKAQDNSGRTKRTVPSAGGTHTFTTFLYIQNVEGLKAGLYRFLAAEHALLFIEESAAVAEEFFGGFKNKNLPQGSAVTFVWATDAAKMRARFGARGMRYVWLDAGHVCQNLYLAAFAVGIGVCAVGAFDDAKLAAALKLPNNADCFIAYAATVGKM